MHVWSCEILEAITVVYTCTNIYMIIMLMQLPLKALSQLAHDQKRLNSRAIEKFRFGS